MKYLFYAILILTLFNGCEKKLKYAKTDIELVLKTDNEKQLVKRVLKYWDLMSKKEFDKTYPMELPYQQYLYPLSKYKLINSGNNAGYYMTIQNISIKENNATISLKYKLNNTKLHLTDNWVKIKDIWYHKKRINKLPNNKDVD